MTPIYYCSLMSTETMFSCGLTDDAIGNKGKWFPFSILLISVDIRGVLHVSFFKIIITIPLHTNASR